MNLAFLNIGSQEMILIVLVALLLFGGKKLPELARGLGRGIREFKDASEGIKKEISDQINNFEREVDVIKSDIDQQPTTSNAQADTTNPETENPEEQDQLAKSAPQFSAAAGTYEHQPYSTPTADDYYSYGYKDHFASDEPGAAQEPSKEETADAVSTIAVNEKESTEETKKV